MDQTFVLLDILLSIHARFSHCLSLFGAETLYFLENGECSKGAQDVLRKC